ncbi:MAG TPA: hypothetical protein VH325_02905 [Bryobacteraceae bacterium]|nr:hypothetical protein [Bryobacteraceae bacterium]
MRKHGIVDSAADNPQSGRSFEGIGVFITVECDDRKPLADTANEEQACSPLMRCLPGIRVNVE